MAYNLSDRMDYLGTRRQEVDYEGVIVNDGDGNMIIENASLGRTEGEEMIPGVAITNVRYQDFIFDWEDLDFGSGPAFPERSWTITRGNGQVFSVTSLAGDDAPPYEFITSTRKRIRIHTMLKVDA